MLKKNINEDELEDARLFTLAQARLSGRGSEDVLSDEEFWRGFIITQEEMDGVGEVELE